MPNKRGEMMLARYELTFDNQHNNEINMYYGSLLHGYLMGKVSGPFAEDMHISSMKPVSQYLYFDNSCKSWKWSVHSLNQRAGEELEASLSGVKEIYLKQKGCSYLIDSITMVATSYRDLTEKIYCNEPKKRIGMRIETPCAFKSHNQIVFFPQIHLIYQNLINRWNLYSDTIKIQDKEAFDQIVASTQIYQYHIRTNSYHLESSRVKGFMGKILFNVNGPQTLVSLCNLLFYFSEYSGLGIKSTLGMGGIHIE